MSKNLTQKILQKTCPAMETKEKKVKNKHDNAQGSDIRGNNYQYRRKKTIMNFTQYQ